MEEMAPFKSAQDAKVHLDATARSSANRRVASRHAKEEAGSMTVTPRRLRISHHIVSLRLRRARSKSAREILRIRATMVSSFMAIDWT